MAEKTRCEECNRDFPNNDALAMHNSAKHQNNSKIKMNSKSGKPMLTIAIIVLLLIGGGFMFFNNKSVVGDPIVNQDNSNPSTNGEVQKITLSMKGNYYPNTIKVKEGTPVELTLDNSVRGCYRSFNIKSLGVSGYSATPSQTITFTPNQKGTFEFACGMRMGRGTIIVE